MKTADKAEAQARSRRRKQQAKALRQKEAEIAREHEMRPDQRKASQPAAGDKLDRILEKLEQLERRLDKLERHGR